MNFAYRRTYRGPIEAVLFDWAGTVMDFGSMAPAAAFVQLYARRNVPISVDEARAPMGKHKKAHIEQIFAQEPVRRRWQEAHGRAPNAADVDAMYDEFVPLQLACLAQHATLIPGALEVVAELRQRGIKIGSTTGFSGEMMEINRKEAKRQGYDPDSTVCATDVPTGRPYPYMCLQIAINLRVTTVQSCVNVDDTIPGVEAGLNAGMWTVGLAVSGNEVGLSLETWQALPESEKALKRGHAYARMHQCGAHYVIDTVADLMPCIEDIQARIQCGEAP